MEMTLMELLLQAELQIHPPTTLCGRAHKNIVKAIPLVQQLQASLEPLKKFARQIIKDVCWNMYEPDGGDIQEVAEKLGLIKPVEATENDVDEESDFEVGDTIFKFTDILKVE